MIENEILCKIFESDIQIERNSYSVNTQYGNITINIDDMYPKTLPDIAFNFYNKTLEDKIRTSNLYTLLNQLKGRHMIYSIVYLCLSIIENRSEKDTQQHLEEVQEIDDQTFLEWKASKTKPKKDETVITGKLYFQKLIEKDRKMPDS